MSGETIEQWAARRAHQLDAEGWSWTNSCSYCDEWFDAVSPYFPGATVRTMKDALLAYRDMVAGLLRPGYREAIIGDTDLCGEPGFEWLRDTLRVVDEDGGLTDFGQEIRRVLLADGTTPE